MTLDPRPARLVRRTARQVRAPDLDILGARLEAYILDSSSRDYCDLSISYTLDEAAATLAHFVYLRDALDHEIAEALAEQDLPGTLPPAIRGLGLPAQMDRAVVEDMTETTLMLYGADLVFGIHVTATDPGATAAALDFALARILPQFLETS